MMRLDGMAGTPNKLRSLIPIEDPRAIQLGLCFLRVCVGLGLVTGYGWSRLMHAGNYIFQGQEWPFLRTVTSLGFPLPVVFATASALAESLCAVLLVAGLRTRVNAALIAFNMLVAVWSHVRLGQPLEPASLYLCAALTLVLSGGGTYSLDALWTRRSSYRASSSPRPYPRPEPNPTALG
jgi:putative oxidoreductase